MIGWYCNAGYYKGAADDFKNVSQLTILDTNVPFTLPIIKSLPPESILQSGYLGSDDLVEMYSLIDTYYGPDWYTTYGKINNWQGNPQEVNLVGEKFKAFMPAWNASWKNTNDFIINISTFTEYKEYVFCIHIPNLKRCLIWHAQSSDTLFPLMRVEADGSFSRISEIDSYGTILATSLSDKGNERYEATGYHFVLAVPFTSYDVLKDPNNFRVLRIADIHDDRVSTYPYDYNIGRWEQLDPSQGTSQASYIFTDGDKPDFEGDEPPEPPPENPYEPGGPSGPSQSTDPSAPGYVPPGTFDDKSDPIPDSSLPTLSAANTGFTRIYNPTLAQVQNLARYLWTDESVIQTIWNHIKQFFEDPMEAIIGFNLVPVAVPNGGTDTVKILFIDTGVSMTVAANQFVDVDCGSVELERFYGSALDQSPYTKVSCFLPYIGTVHLNTDEVMGTTLQVIYRVDIVSGSCVAKILVDGSVLYQYSGHCAISIPFSSANFSSYVTAAISVAKLAIGTIVGGGAGAISALSTTDPSQETNQVVTTKRVETETVRNPATGRQVTSGTRTTVETRESPVDISSTQSSFDYLSPANVANTVGQVMSSKPTIERSGSFSGNTGYLGVRRPFLVIERPNMCLPENYQHLNGYPAMITMELSTCKGFTRIQQVELTGMTATNPEQSEILGLLKSGVFF